MEKTFGKNRLWGRIMLRHRIHKQETVTIENDDIEEAFLEICRRFDVQRPLQLPKHNREFESFGRTFYTKEHFTESVDFDRLEIELIMPDGEKRSSGMRNPLMDAWAPWKKEKLSAASRPRPAGGCIWATSCARCSPI